MKLKTIVEQEIEVTWEGGRLTPLYAVMFKSIMDKGSVVAVFNSRYWAQKFVDNADIKHDLSIHEVIR